jgi:hypothetical protein
MVVSFVNSIQRSSTIANPRECRLQAARCGSQSRMTVNPVIRTITANMSKSWTVLANQMDRLHNADATLAVHLAQAIPFLKHGDVVSLRVVGGEPQSRVASRK